MRRVYGDGIDQLLARIDGAGTASWYHQDRLGSVVGITDNSGTLIDSIAYDAFLNVTSESNPANGDDIRGTGRLHDAETGLQRHGEREYNPPTGTWLEQDPDRFGAGDANLMRYVGNNPTNATDPSGLEPLNDPREAVNWNFLIEMDKVPEKGSYTIDDKRSGVKGILKRGLRTKVRYWDATDPENKGKAFEKDIKPEKIKTLQNGVSIWFDGSNAHKVDFVQFFKDFAVTGTLDKPEQKPTDNLTYRDDIEIDVPFLGKVQSSPSGKMESGWWYLDGKAEFTNTKGRGVFSRRGNILAMHDVPVPALGKLLNKYPASENPKIKYWGHQTWFVTYVVVDGRAIGVVVWNYTYFTEDGKLESTKVAMQHSYIGLPTNEELKKVLLQVYKNQKEDPEQNVFTK